MTPEKQKLVEKLRLILEIEENDLPFEVKYRERDWKPTPYRAVVYINNTNVELRIKPAQFIPLPEGQFYWNPENKPAEWFETHKGWRPLLKGEASTEEDECITAPFKIFERVFKLSGKTAGGCGVHNWVFRTKRPLPEPKPVILPLNPEDAPPGSAFRQHGWDAPMWQMATAVDGERVHFGDSSRTFEQLRDNNWAIKRPGETQWSPCSKTAK